MLNDELKHAERPRSAMRTLKQIKQQDGVNSLKAIHIQAEEVKSELAASRCSAPPSDTERLQWCLKYVLAKTLAGAETFDDWEYHALTLDLIDKAIIREREKAQNAAAEARRTGDVDYK